VAQTQARSTLTRAQVADELQVSLRTVDNLIARGDLPAYRVGGHLIRVKRGDLERFISSEPVVPAEGAA
jgi:excisionase family DNA binding protein